MKAEIDKFGTLIISPDSPLEAFALKCWAEKNILPEGAIRPKANFLIYTEKRNETD